MLESRCQSHEVIAAGGRPALEIASVEVVARGAAQVSLAADATVGDPHVSLAVVSIIVVSRISEGRPLVDQRSSESYASFDAFAAAPLPALLRYARVLTDGGSEAEDIVQAALVRTGVAWGRVRRKDDPEGYVRRTMMRLVMNEGRRRGREVSIERLPESGSMEAG